MAGNVLDNGAGKKAQSEENKKEQEYTAARAGKLQFIIKLLRVLSYIKMADKIDRFYKKERQIQQPVKIVPTQNEIIRHLAFGGDCVIVGHCSDVLC